VVVTLRPSGYVVVTVFIFIPGGHDFAGVVSSSATTAEAVGTKAVSVSTVVAVTVGIAAASSFAVGAEGSTSVTVIIR
jgi:hypothetical protein